MRPVYENNKNAPRMRKGKYSSSIITQDLWKEFKEKFPEYSKMSWPEFSEVWGDIAQTVRTECVQNTLGVKLGSYTGELKLQYLPHKFPATNPYISSEEGEKVNNINLSSRGKVAKIKWERRWAVKFNRFLQFFAFEPNREINKLAKDHIDNIPNSIRVSRNTLGGKSKWRDKIK